MDIVFALDSSKPSDFEQQKSFVATMINSFTISKSQTQVGLITVLETARKDIELTDYSQPGLLKDRVAGLTVEKVIPSVPSSRLRDMLRKTLQIFKNGGRSGVRATLSKMLDSAVLLNSSYFNVKLKDFIDRRKN